MKLQELQKLAERVQLKIKSDEASHILDSFSKLEKLLGGFRQLKSENEECLPLAKITLQDLRQLTKIFSMHTVKQENIIHNATLSAQNFLIIGKKKVNYIE